MASKRNDRIGAGIPLLLGAMTASAAQAAGWRWAPAVGLEERYDDNVRLEADEAESVLATRVSGVIALSRQTDITSVEGLARIDAINYSSSDVDRNNRSNQLVRVESSRIGERSRAELDASLRRDTLLRTVDAFDLPDEVEVDPDEDVDVGIVDLDIRRNRLIIEPGWQYSTSPRHSVGLSYRMHHVTYGNTQSVSLSDFRDNTLVGYSDYGLTELDRLRSRIEVSSYRANNLDREYTTYAVLSGIDHAFSPVTSGGAELGVHRTDFDTEVEKGSARGLLVRLFGERDLGLTRFSGRASRRLYPSGGGDVVRSNEVAFNMIHEVSELAHVAVRTRLFENESLRSDNPSVNRRYFSIEPRFNWKASQRWTVEASYRYRRQKRDMDANSAESNAVFLSVYYSVPADID